jgi:CysZ protein
MAGVRRVRGFNGFVVGASYPLRALSLLGTHRELWRYVLVPVLINVLLLVVLTTALLIPGFRLIDQLMAQLPPWLALLEWLLRGLLVLTLLLVNGFLLAQFGVALGAPWYSTLSARLEQLVVGNAPPESPLTPFSIVRDVTRALFFQLGRLLIAISAFCLFLPLNLIPGIGGLIATVGNSVVGALLLTLDFLDPPLDRRLLPFRQKLGVVRRNLGLSLGLGLVCLALVSIPLLNLFTIPLCVVAGTLLYCDHIRPVAPS